MAKQLLPISYSADDTIIETVNKTNWDSVNIYIPLHWHHQRLSLQPSINAR